MILRVWYAASSHLLPLPDLPPCKGGCGTGTEGFPDPWVLRRLQIAANKTTCWCDDKAPPQTGPTTTFPFTRLIKRHLIDSSTGVVKFVNLLLFILSVFHLRLPEGKEQSPWQHTLDLWIVARPICVAHSQRSTVLFPGRRLLDGS